MIPARLRWLWLTLAVVLLDRASKAWFESQTVEGWHRELIHNFIYLVHSRNPGIAFGVFADSPSTTMRILLIVGSAVVIGALAWLFVAGHSGGSLTAAGLALLLGGATGNVTSSSTARSRTSSKSGSAAITGPPSTSPTQPSPSAPPSSSSTSSSSINTTHQKSQNRAPANRPGPKAARCDSDSLRPPLAQKRTLEAYN